MIYEAMLLFAVVFVAGYLFDTLTQSRSALTLRHAREAWLFLMLGVYFVWFWSHKRQTLAMKTWHMRVVEADGRGLSTKRAILRYLLSWIFLLPTLAVLGSIGFRGNEVAGSIVIALAFIVPPFWMKLDRDQQFLHDRILGTRLVVV
jgi:uncharacterized RDD family membrane protein YckC